MTAARWRGAALVTLLAAVPAVLAWAAWGPMVVADSRGYLDYAAMIRDGTLPDGAAVLRSGPVPISLFRMGGYPAVLAGLQSAVGPAWPHALVALQIAAAAAVAGCCYRAARLALGLRPVAAALASLLPAVGFGVVAQVSVLSDAFCGALLTAAAVALLLRRGWGAYLLAGLALAASATLREATVVLAPTYVPLALCGPGRLRARMAGAAAMVALPWAVGAAQVGWNVSRGAGPILTTSPQTVMVQAVLPLLRQGLPVYDGDDVFARTARSTVGVDGYAAMERMHQALFDAGMTAPEMARAAQRAYAAAWADFPLHMASVTLHELRPGYAAMPFQPLDVMWDLRTYAAGPAGGSARPREAWLVRMIDGACKSAGVAITVSALLMPWVVRGAWRLRAAWCLFVGLAAVYAPVHVEPRYLAADLPMVALVGCWGLSEAWRWRWAPARWMPRRSNGGA